MNYLEKVSFAFTHGKEKAREKMTPEELREIEERKRRRQQALMAEKK